MEWWRMPHICAFKVARLWNGPLRVAKVKKLTDVKGHHCK